MSIVVGRRGRAILSAAALAACLALGVAAASRSIWYESTDFYCLWAGARLVGHGADPYDASVWRAATGGPHPDPRGGTSETSCASQFSYPLWTAIALLPFGALPLPAASSAWAGVSFLGVLVGAVASWRAAGGGRRGSPLFAALVLTAQPLWLLVISGQLTGVLLGLAGLSARRLARADDGRAGAIYGLLALKPQLIALSGPVLFGWGIARRPRFALASGTVVAGMAVVTVALAPGWPGEWLAEVAGRRLGVAALLPTAWGLSADLFGTVLAAPVLIVLVVALSIALARGRTTPVGLAAIALAISVFAAPHAWSYDHLVLVLPWALTLAIAERSSGRRRIALLLATAGVASLLPWVLYAIAFARGGETLNAVVPALTALLVAAAVGTEPAAGGLAVDGRSAPPRRE